jgi:hypothetical protein
MHIGPKEFATKTYVDVSPELRGMFDQMHRHFEDRFRELMHHARPSHKYHDGRMDPRSRPY